MNDTKFIMELAIDKNNLDALIHMIIDNAELNYTKSDLRITNESTIVQFIKYLYPKTYNDKLEQLKRDI